MTLDNSNTSLMGIGLRFLKRIPNIFFDRKGYLFVGTLLIIISPFFSCLFFSCMILSSFKGLKQIIKNRQQLIVAILLIVVSIWFLYRKVLPEEIVPGTVAFSDYIPFFWFFFLISLKPFSDSETKLFYFALLLTIPQQFIISLLEEYFQITGRFFMPNSRIPLLELSIGPIEKGLAVSGVFYNPNILALYCVICSSLAGAFLMNEISFYKKFERSKLIKIISSSMFLIFLLIILLWTGSRNGWLAFILMMLLFCVMNKKIRRILIPTIGILLLLIIVVANDFDSATKFLKTIFPKSIIERVNDSSPERDIHYKCAIQLIKEKPWVGWGIGNYKRVCSQYFPYQIAHAHNLFLQLAVEIGLPGTLTVIILFGYLLLSVIKDQFIKKTNITCWLDYGLLVAVIGTIAMQFIDLALLMTYRLNFLFWICFAIPYSKKSNLKPAEYKK